MAACLGDRDRRRRDHLVAGIRRRGRPVGSRSARRCSRRSRSSRACSSSTCAARAARAARAAPHRARAARERVGVPPARRERARGVLPVRVALGRADLREPGVRARLGPADRRRVQLQGRKPGELPAPVDRRHRRARPRSRARGSGRAAPRTAASTSSTGSRAATAKSAGSTTARSRCATRDGRVVRIAGIAEDVTERTRGELRSRDLIESAPDAMVIIDAVGPDRARERADREAVRLRARGADGRPGRDPAARALPRASTASTASHFLAAPRVRPMGAGIDLYARRKNGEEFPVEISLSPLETDLGPVVSASIRDITEARARAARARAPARCARERQPGPRALELRARAVRVGGVARSPGAAAQAGLVLGAPARRPRRRAPRARRAGPRVHHRCGAPDAHARERPAHALAHRNERDEGARGVARRRASTACSRRSTCAISETRAVITRDPLPDVMGDPTLLEELYQNLLSNALKFVAPGTSAAHPPLRRVAAPTAPG